MIGSSTPTNRPFFSRFLVTLQFIGLAVALYPWHQWGMVSRWWAVLLIVAGALLAVWAVWHNRPGNFRVLPELTEGGALITSGPYARIRHPMYSALLLVGAGGALASGHGLNLVGWGMMAWALWAKAEREESLLLLVFGQYAAYRSRTRRFIPGLW